ncbi:MAG: hypothetical protein KME67_20650 [Candidatus Thiodiazotropha sp. (ex Codakia orbicularis)]|nr:hypothetical protein [Candidatus Thiodiazotropha sp. (ex Codakia orbicularis)]
MIAREFFNLETPGSHYSAQSNIKPLQLIGTINMLVSDLFGKKVYMIGGGWIGEGKPYLKSRKLNALRAFWEAFFAASGAALEGLFLDIYGYIYGYELEHRHPQYHP